MVEDCKGKSFFEAFSLVKGDIFLSLVGGEKMFKRNCIKIRRREKVIPVTLAVIFTYMYL